MNIFSLHGNWVDLIIIAFILFYIWDGWGKGLVSQMIELVVFVGAFVLALKLYPIAAQILVNNFSFPHGLAKALGFFILGIVFEQILSHVGEIVMVKIPPRWEKHPINKFLGIVPQLLNAAIIIAFILTLALSLPIQGHIKADISQSKLGGPLINRTQSLEKTLGKMLGEALSDSFNFITTGPTTQDKPVKLNFTQHEVTIDENSENEMLVEVNTERRDRGLKALQFDIKLRDLGRSYAKDMFGRGYFSHYNPEGESPFERMEKSGINYQTAGENLAFAPTVAIAHQGLMDSPGHRENILNPAFGRVGIGVIDGGVYGKMFVQEFTD